MAGRKYTLKQRAAKQAQTRERIVDAAMALHEELGPGETTISAVAERAGVQRLTVYRHFAGDQELFLACTGKWLQLNPPPDIAGLRQTDPLARTRAAIGRLYDYYRRTERMWSVAYRDLDRVPALAGPMGEFEAYLGDIERDLLARFAPAPARKARLAATLGHALRFSTWRSLASRGLSDASMARLVCDWIGAAG